MKQTAGYHPASQHRAVKVIFGYSVTRVAFVAYKVMWPSRAGFLGGR